MTDGFECYTVTSQSQAEMKLLQDLVDAKILGLVGYQTLVVHFQIPEFRSFKIKVAA